MKNKLQQCASAEKLLIRAETVTDQRGSLTFVEKGVLPFTVERIFWIKSVPVGKTRGGHAHRTCIEAVFAAAGAFDIAIETGTQSFDFHISADDSCGVLVPAGAWCELRNFSDDCVCIVAASEKYDGDGYIKSHDEYINLLRNGLL